MSSPDLVGPLREAGAPEFAGAAASPAPKTSFLGRTVEFIKSEKSKQIFKISMHATGLAALCALTGFIAIKLLTAATVCVVSFASGNLPLAFSALAIATVFSIALVSSASSTKAQFDRVRNAIQQYNKV